MDLEKKEYREALAYQKELHGRRRKKEIPDTLVLVEHQPVYTLGKTASKEHITCSDAFLEEEGIDVVQIERGGEVTYHGPGQVVGYPIIDLRDHRKNVHWYIRSLEETIIRALDQLGVESHRREGHPGVWLGKDKICAIGVRIARWVTYHGFALNREPNLEHFNGIVPCGIEDGWVTSLRRELSKTPGRSVVIEAIVGAFQDVFEFTEVEWSD